MAPRGSTPGSEELAGLSWVCGVEDGLGPRSPSPAVLTSVTPVLFSDICLCPENLGPCLFLCSTEEALLSPLNVWGDVSPVGRRWGALRTVSTPRLFLPSLVAQSPHAGGNRCTLATKPSECCSCSVAKSCLTLSTP